MPIELLSYNLDDISNSIYFNDADFLTVICLFIY